MDFQTIITYGGAAIAILSLVAQAYAFFKARQWGRLVATGGAIALEVAKLTGFSNKAKRAEAIRRLYKEAPPIARQLFTEEQFGMAVEKGYQLIAQPELKGGPAS